MSHPLQARSREFLDQDVLSKEAGTRCSLRGGWSESVISHEGAIRAKWIGWIAAAVLSSKLVLGGTHVFLDLYPWHGVGGHLSCGLTVGIAEFRSDAFRLPLRNHMGRGCLDD